MTCVYSTYIIMHALDSQLVMWIGIHDGKFNSEETPNSSKHLIDITTAFYQFLQNCNSQGTITLLLKQKEHITFYVLRNTYLYLKSNLCCE